MSKYKVIDNIHRFLIKIDGKEFDDFPKLKMEAKALRWDLEEIFHFSGPQQAIETGEETKCTCGKDQLQPLDTMCPIHGTLTHRPHQGAGAGVEKMIITTPDLEKETWHYVYGDLPENHGPVILWFSEYIEIVANNVTIEKVTPECQNYEKAKEDFEEHRWHHPKTGKCCLGCFRSGMFFQRGNPFVS